MVQLVSVHASELHNLHGPEPDVGSDPVLSHGNRHKLQLSFPAVASITLLSLIRTFSEFGGFHFR